MCGFTYNTIIHRYFYDILMYTSPTLSQPCPSAMLQSWSIRPPPCLVWGPSLALDQLGKACSVRIDDGQKKMMLRKMFFVCLHHTACFLSIKIWHLLHLWEQKCGSRSYSSSQEPTWHPRAHGRLEALHRFLGDGWPALRPLRESGCRNCSDAYQIQKGSAVTKPSELVEPSRTW